MFKKTNLILMMACIACMWMPIELEGYAFDVRDLKYDRVVSSIYDFAQAHPDLIILSSNFMTLYNQFHANNYTITVDVYMKMIQEIQDYKAIISNYANDQTLTQQFIEEHS